MIGQIETALKEITDRMTQDSSSAPVKFNFNDTMSYHTGHTAKTRSSMKTRKTKKSAIDVNSKHMESKKLNVVFFNGNSLVEILKD